ncbi:cation:proton antiporter [Marinitoga sp. 1137]|uniref:monovalent cation/H(+) antiporter subunit G n=1 Tax=Marinitoga sp. 1137 TaxID=1545835 RepID=UPI00095089EE|nr:monovalent cation/H(+) antiporter subunit G [Marinitoga sp. 1137]APT75562.1 cation:proton antiporter [Marinitoga sp. 1137]
MSAIGYILMIIGALFYVLGGLGLYRMPDVYNRLQAATKATTLGTFSLVLGVGIVQPAWFIKTLLIVVFLTITNPVGSSVLAKASYIYGAKPFKLVKNELDELYNKSRGDENADN